MTRNNLKIHTEKITLKIAFVPFLVASLLGGCAGRTDQENKTAPHSNARLVAQVNGLCLDTRLGKMWQVGRSKTFTSLEAA